MPSGLTWDEGAEGLEAADPFHGQFPVLFPEQGGHEPLIIYLQSLSLKAFGWSAASLRLPVIFMSMLGLAATYLVARKLFGRSVGLLATFLEGVTLWQVTMARWGGRAAALTLFNALTMFWLYRWLRGERPWRSASLCGLFAGLAMYAYTPARLLVVIPLLAWLWSLWRAKRRSGLLGQGAVAAGVGSLTLVPLVWYVVRSPDTFFARANQLSVLSSGVSDRLGEWLTSVRATALMFNVTGEIGWDRNISGLPIFDPIVSLLFLAGVGICLWRIRRLAYGLTLLWLACTVAPLTLAVTFHGSSDFHRAAAAAPPLFMLPALAAVAFQRRCPWLRSLLWVGALAAGVVGFIEYFAIWAPAPERQPSFRPGVLQAATSAVQRLAAPDSPVRVYYGAPEAYDATADFIAAGFGIEHPDQAQRLIEYDAANTRVAPPVGSESYVISDGRPAVRAFAAPAHAMQTSLGSALIVDGYDLPSSVAPGGALGLAVHWHPQTAPSGQLTFFAHLLDYRQQGALAELDQNGFPPSSWRGGESVLSTFPLQVPPGATPGAYWIEFGAYTDGQQRLRTARGEDRLLLGPVVVAGSPLAAAAPQADLGGMAGLLSRQVSRSDDGLDVDLTWLPRRPIHANYSVFVHVLDAAGRVVAQADGPPAGGAWPAQYWLTDVPVDDRHHVPLPRLPAGRYDVTVGLYQPDTGERLSSSPSASPEPDSLLVGAVTLE